VAFRIDFTYGFGGYLATKTFVNPSTGASVGWDAIHWERDGNTGKILSSFDPAGTDSQYRTSYQYDDLGRLTQIKPPSPDYATGVAYPSLHETQVRQWANSGNSIPPPACSASDDCIETRYYYDDLSRLARTKKRDATSAWTTQISTYNALSNPVDTSEWVSLNSSDQPIDPSGNVYCIGPVGPTCPVLHGELNLVLVGSSSPSPAYYPVNHFDYKDLVSNTTQDPFGRAWVTTSADKTITRTIYRGMNTDVTIKDINAPIGPAFDTTTTYSKDALGRLVDVSFPSGRYSVSGGMLPLTAARAEYVYDWKDNLTRVSVIAPDSTRQERSFEYDGLDRLIREDNPENGTTLYTLYDPLGNLLQKQDNAGMSWSMSYDKAARLLETQIDGKLLSHNTYDSALDAGCSVNADRAKGKLAKVESFSDAGGGVPQTIQRYCYEGPSGRLSAQYTAFSDWAPGSGLKVNYYYNGFGLRSRLTYPDDGTGQRTLRDLTSQYKNGYLNKLKDTPSNGDTHVSDIQYNAAGGIREIDMPKSQDIITPDARSRPSKVVFNQLLNGQQTSTLFDSGAYAYDGAGNISRIGTGKSYIYDEANRLVHAEETEGSTLYNLNWSYDPFGNMNQATLQVGGGPATTRLISNNLQNRIQSVTEGGTTTPFSYDARGNVTVDKDHSYDYDPRNRMRSIYLNSPGNPQGAVMQGSFTYDATGNRAVKTMAGLTTYYVRDQEGQVLSEFRKSANSANTPAWDRDYLYAAGRLVAEAENDTPDPPRNLMTQPRGDPNWITLTWQAPADSDVSNYKVYRGATLVGSPTGTLFQQNLPSSTTRYDFKVTAVDAAGNESDSSQVMSWIYADYSGPTQPGVITATAGDGRVSLSWLASNDDVQLLGYVVIRECSSCTPIQTVISPTDYLRTTSIMDVGLTNGTNYTYIVVPFDTANNSGPSRTASATPLDLSPPSPPRGLVVQPSCDSADARKVFLAWSANTTNEGVVEYRVFRDGAFQVRPGPLTATTFDDILPGAQTQANYTIVARDAAGRDSVACLPVSVSLRDLKTPPDAPMIPPDPLALGEDVRVSLKWTGAICDNDTPACKSFGIYRRLNMERNCLDFKKIGTVVMDEWSAGNYSFVDTSVTNAIAYEYALTIIDESGREGAFSKISMAVALETPKDVYRCRPQSYFPPECQPTTCPTAPINACATWVYHWRPVSTPAYQPYNATALTAPEGFLKGYRAYEHYASSITVNYLTWHDDNMRTKMDFGIIWGRDVDFREQQSNIDFGNRCHVFTAVYKVLVNGTWQTMESGWSNNFDSSVINTGRCPSMDTNQAWCTLPICESQTFVPPPPQNVTAEPGPGPNQITVHWSPPTSGNEIYPDLAGYYLYVKDPNWDTPLAGAGEFSTRRFDQPVGALFRSDHPLIRLDPGFSSVTLNGLKPCRVYSFYLTAISGSGRISEPSNTTILPVNPYASNVPLGLRPRLWTSNDSYFRFNDPPSASTEKARLVFDSACNGGTDLQQFTESSGWTTINPGSIDPNTPSQIWEWTLAPTKGELTYYRYSNAATPPSPPVAIEVLPHDSPPLSAPTHMDALYQDDGTIKLRWCPNPAAEGIITGLRILRSTTSGGPYTQIGADLSPGVHLWTDPGPITPVTIRYYYVIAAVRDAQVSAYSRENGAGNTSQLGQFDPDSYNWNGQSWLSPTPTAGQLLLFCDDDYVKNGIAPFPDQLGSRAEPLASKAEPASIEGMEREPRIDDSQPAPYRVVGTPGNPPFHYTYYHLDHLGSPRILTNKDGVKVQGQHFLPFGQEMPIEAGVNSRKFTGHERDPETGLDYMMARYYQANLGRFMAVDPSGRSIVRENPQSWNRYSYSLNNPLRYTDPDGKAYTSQDGQEEHNKVITDPKRNSTEKGVVSETAKAPQSVDVEKVPEAKVEIALPGGTTLEATGDAQSVKGLVKSQQKQGNFNETPIAENYDAKVDPQTGKVVEAKVTLYKGTYDISKQGVGTPGKTRDQFVTDSFVHGSAHVGGPRPRTEQEVDTMLGY